MVTGLKVPGKIPRREGEPGARRMKSMTGFIVPERLGLRLAGPNAPASPPIGGDSEAELHTPENTTGARLLSRPWSVELGGQKFVHRLALGFELMAVGGFLTPDAIFGPWYCIQALCLDFLFAMKAGAIAAIANAA